MAPLIRDRNTPRAEGDFLYHPLAAGVVIYAGAQVCLDAAGNLVPGGEATTLTAAGRAEERVDNTGGASGDKSARVRRGVFRWDYSAAADEITRADIGAAAYVVDDQTVARTDGTGTRSAAGIIRDVDAQGVWVKV